MDFSLSSVNQVINAKPIRAIVLILPAIFAYLSQSIEEKELGHREEKEKRERRKAMG